VARDARVRDFLEPARARAYLPFPISPFASVVLRAHAGGDNIIARSREVVAALDPGLPIYDAGTVRAATEREMAEEALVARLVLLFAVLAALLAAVGLYGVVSTQAAERRRELGIRAALGARPRQLVAAMTTQAMWLAVSGLAAGLVSSLWLTRFVSSRLYGVDRLDLASFGAAAAGALAVALIAAAVPARRAGRVDPIIALRH
jgi:ABC-type antimicrobial peptide transport system permease subunit